jgi:GT2 family glycosyltransferase
MARPLTQPAHPARAEARSEVVIDPDRVPIAVAELECAAGAEPSLRLAARAEGRVPPGAVLALVRAAGRPVGMVQAEIGPGEDAVTVLAAAARARFADALAEPPPARPAAARQPLVSVVVATRDRPQLLARCLESLAALEYPRYEVVVVDNNPATDATAELVKARFADSVRYVREPRPGLAAAHNRGLAEALGEVVAFTDDDVVVDPGWLDALVGAFAEVPDAGCVTGLILPARLATRAQAMLEAHGGFAKGFRRRVHHLAAPPPDQPLFPFTAGRLGSGANMAFRASPLRALGGFDPATGTGTPARGGDDLLSFLRVLAAGHALVYQPEALVWHHHRERQEDLEAQAFGYGAGLGAYLTAAVAREPRLLPALLRRLPGGVRYALTRTAARPPDAATGEAVPGGHAWPAHLSRLERRGLLYGPVGYLRSRLRVRGTTLPWEVHQHGH